MHSSALRWKGDLQLHTRDCGVEHRFQDLQPCRSQLADLRDL